MRNITEQIQFRPIEPEDLESLRSHLNDSAAVQFSSPYRPISRRQQQEWYESLQRDRSRHVLAIVDRTKNLAIGTVGLYNIHSIHQNAEFKIRIGDSGYHGKQIGTLATEYMVDYAFRHLRLRRVWLHVFENNERALAMYEKVGFVREGLLRKAAYINGQELNLVVMGILAEEWRAKGK